MNLAYFSPLPPATTGVADYSAALLPELARLARVDLYWDQPTALARAFTVRPLREYERCRAQYDAVFYQLGNSRFHHEIFDTLLRFPGIVVLHDGSLHHFFVERTLHLGNAPAYLREMAYAHGAAGYDAALLIARGAGILPFYNFPLLRRALDRAHGVIVHSAAIRRAALAARPDARVAVVEHFAFAAPAPTQTRAEMLRQLGFPRASFVIASFGQVGYGKRAEVVLDAFAQFAAKVPRACFVWVGDLFGEYDVRPHVRRLGLDARVVFTGRVAEQVLANYHALADVAVNLRYPTTGEASGALMRLLAYGKPTLVSNAGWFAELPPTTVAHIDLGRDEANAIAAALTRLAADRAWYAQMSDAAREYARARTVARAAQAYLDFASSVMEFKNVRAA